MTVAFKKSGASLTCPRIHPTNMLVTLKLRRLVRNFSSTRGFSSNCEVACATCHLLQKQFQDGTPLARGVGTTNRQTMTIIGTAYSPWLFWDGRKDSLWAQALGPMESPVEHGGNRTLYAHLIAEKYAVEYTTLFGPLPDLSALSRNVGPVANVEAAMNWETMSPGKKRR